jgi:hypothetical protein
MNRTRTLIVALFACLPACLSFVHLEGGACRTDAHCPRDAGLVCAAAGAVSCTCQPATAGPAACTLDVRTNPGDGGTSFEWDGGDLEPRFTWSQREYWVLPTEGTQAMSFTLKLGGARVVLEGSDAAVAALERPVPVPSSRQRPTTFSFSIVQLDGGTSAPVDGGPGGLYRLRLMPAPLLALLGGPLGNLGASVALEGDALVAGEPSTNEGQVRLRHLPGPSEHLLVAAAGGVAGLGSTLALQGGLLVVGSPYSSNGGLAHLAWVNADGGFEPIHDLLSLGSDGGRFGVAVALADGVVACGDGAGKAGIYEWSGGETWTLTAQFDGGGVFGGAIALSSGRLAIGAPIPIEGRVPASEVQLYARADGGTWERQGPLRSPAGGVFKPYVPVLAMDAHTLVVGDQLADATGFNSGAVYVYRLVDGGWNPESTLTSSAVAEHFGAAVALADDHLAVGVPNYATNAPGAVFLFARMNDGGWEQVGFLRPPGVQGMAEFGRSLAYGPSGLAVGAPLAGQGAGAVYVYPNAP